MRLAQFILEIADILPAVIVLCLIVAAIAFKAGKVRGP